MSHTEERNTQIRRQRVNGRKTCTQFVYKRTHVKIKGTVKRIYKNSIKEWPTGYLILIVELYISRSSLIVVKFLDT